MSRSLAPVVAVVIALTACGLWSSEYRADAPTSDTSDAAAAAQDASPSEDDAAVLDAGHPFALEVIARDQGRPKWVVMDADAVYWVNEGVPTDAGRKGEVMRFGRGPGAKPTTLAAGQPTISALAQDNKSLYWFVVSSPGACQAKIAFVNKDATGQGSFYYGCYESRALQPDVSFVYLMDSFGAIGRMGKGDGNYSVIVDKDLTAVGLKLSGTELYFGTGAEGAIKRLDTTTDQVTLFAAGQNGPSAIDADDTHVYWVTNPGGTVARLDKSAGGQAAETLVAKQLQPSALAVDATHVYFATAGDGRVSRAPKGGGPAEVLATGFSKPCGVAAYDGDVFVTDCEAGTVTRIHR